MKITSVLCVAVLAAFSCVATAQDDQPGSTATYRLNDGSQWQEGCFGECLCPISLGDLTGTFALTPIELNGTLDVYEVSDLTWAVSFFEGPVFTVTGDGTYTIFQEVAVQHKMELTLVVDGLPPRAFDNEFDVTTGQFPEIDIVISEFDMSCFDTVFVIDASPIETCLPDTDGSGGVDVDDLMNVLLDWGSNGSANGGDADGNGLVDVDDLVAVMMAWGPCVLSP